MTTKPNTPPIHNLPEELIAEIFRMANDAESCKSGEPPENTMLFPLRLTHVCSRWRNIATFLPPLWTRIRINEAASDSYGHHSILDLFLRRSSHHLLDVDVRIECPSLCRLLFQHSARWRTCHLLLTPEFPAQDSPLSVVRDNIPMLEELGFDFEILTFSEDPLAEPNDANVNPNPNPKRIRTTCWLGDMPKLQRLLLYSVDCYISRLGFPWEQLRHLTLNMSWSSNIDSALRLCPYLESAHFDYIYPQDDHEGDLSSYTCPNLRSLTINNTFGRVCILPQHGIFPSLEELELGGPGEKDANIMVQDLLSLLEKSSCRLQTLSIAGKGLPSSELICLLNGIPSLASFSLSNYYGSPGTDFTEDFLARLCVVAGNQDEVAPSFLPALARLRLEHRREAPTNMDLLLRVVESRRYVGSLENQKGRLHFVDLGHIMTELPDHMLSRLQRLEGDGLEIRLAVPG